ALVAGVAGAAYAQPYLERARIVGTRAPGGIASFSAQLASYPAAPQPGWLWGWTRVGVEGNELRPFPRVGTKSIGGGGGVGRAAAATVWCGSISRWPRSRSNCRSA